MNEDRTQRLESVLAVLLGLAAIITAFAAYQASLKDGDTVKSYNEGIRSLSDANQFYNQAIQQVNRDEGVFLEWAKADQEGNTDLRDYLEAGLMDENLTAAMEEFKKRDDLLSPIAADSYVSADQAEGERLERQTRQKFAQAQELDDEGDGYELVGVIGAVSLFFLGIAGVFRSPRMRLVAAAIGGVVLLVAGVLLAGA
ncbi:MAG TPA: hypothetical protein VHF89_18390 [Solirubrobacteraceae bacterium]|nr:hypothetical protein [Solirubrobacteraceae bacterium]